MDRKFWQGVYDAGDTRFDLKGPSAPLLDWLDANAPRPGSAIVPGCGFGHDVLELARRGWDALGVDLAETPVAVGRASAAKAGLSDKATFLEADVLALDHPAAYDLLFEQTCYCAIEPHRRDDYARFAARVVKPGGTLVFVVFPVDGRSGGPPFNIGVDEVKLRFAAAFDLVRMGPPLRPSSVGRAGKELFAELRRQA